MIKLRSPADSGFTSVAFAALLLALVWVHATCSQEPFSYPEGKSGRGRLAYRQGLPVLEVAGTPAEMGRQVAELALKPAVRILDYPRDFLKQVHLEMTWPLVAAATRPLLNNFPQHHRRELEGIAATIEHHRDHLIAANTMFDVLRGLGCSTLIVDGSRSATKGPLFGRNLDFPTLGYLQEYSLVTVYRPSGKRTFVSVGFPGCIGVLSGMNDAGLTLAVLEVNESKDDSRKFDFQGTPYALCFRKILEECATVDEAERLLRGMRRTTWLNLAVCDRRKAAVFEITPKTIAVRLSSAGITPCTNHFRSPQLGAATECWRYPILERTARDRPLTIRDVHRQLHRVNQGDITLQTMVFEPRALRLHLAIGPTPSSALPLQTLDVGRLLKPREEGVIPISGQVED